MLLGAQAIGDDPFRRFVIMRLEDRSLYNGNDFTEEFDEAQLFFHPSDACFSMQDILKEHYKHLPKRHFVMPVEITVHGEVSEQEIAEYLFQASVLSLRTKELGTAPATVSFCR